VGSPAQSQRIPVSARDRELLRWVSEQYAIRADQLGRLLGRSERTAQRWSKRMEAEDYVQGAPLLAGEPAWTWLTGRGAATAGAGYRPYSPSVARLAHIAAVNEVRLALRREEPAASWTCERALARDREGSVHLPDALLESAEGQLAIEVELVPKARHRVVSYLDDLCSRYDGVVYYCSPRARGLMERLRRSGDWPLVVRGVPGGGDNDPRRERIRPRVRRRPPVSGSRV
jgi:hypothetical protein